MRSTARPPRPTSRHRRPPCSRRRPTGCAAPRAGLQHDDIVLNPDVWEQAHREGALLLVLVLRESAKLLIPVRVGKICID